MYTVRLKKGKDAAIQRGHPWVFSGAIAQTEGKPSDGQIVQVLDHQGNSLGVGHYQQGSISVRMLSFSETSIDEDFWRQRLYDAFAYRSSIGLANSEHTNCYRLVNGPGDHLPGLVIDIYGSTAVIQSHSVGMHQARHAITDALRELYKGRLTAVYDKSERTLPTRYAAGHQNDYLYGEGEPTIVMEYGHRFAVDWEDGQKTGFFLDQRENRHLLAQYVRDRSVLNAFCYSGGFSVYALAAGAASVDSVDISQSAIELTERNVTLNEMAGDRHRAHVADVMDFLKKSEEKYDVIVLDPPAFAKSKHKRHQAVQAYIRLNALALRKLPPGGMLFTFSCTKVVDETLFRHSLVAAGLDAGRRIRIVHQREHPPDHPINIFHPEGAYLKGLVLYVE